MRVVFERRDWKVMVYDLIYLFFKRDFRSSFRLVLVVVRNMC